VLVQRDWRRHWLHLDAAVRHFLAGNLISVSAPNVWLKRSRNMSVLSVQTMLLAAGSNGSGNVPFIHAKNVKCNGDYSVQNDESLRGHCTDERRVRKRVKKERRDVI